MVCSDARPKLLLEVYGVRVAIRSLDPIHDETITLLREDFDHFEVQELNHPAQIELTLATRSAIPALQGRFPVFKTRMCAVYGLGARRSCDYGSGLRVEAENARDLRWFQVIGPESTPAYEVAYTTLLSSIGEALDRLGYHRIHALGLEINDRGTLAVFPAGGGKSSLCAQLLNTPSIRILSDEMPLIRGRTLYPFPIRIALKPEDAARLMTGSKGRPFVRRIFPTKLLFPIPRERVSTPVPVNRLLIHGKGPFPRMSAFFSLWNSMVVGIGLAQMAEHMLRLDSIPSLVLIAFSRLRAAIQVLRTPGLEIRFADSKKPPLHESIFIS